MKKYFWWVHCWRQLHTSSSTSERTYCRVCGWLSRCRMVVIRASLIRLSWQSITFFRMVLRPPLLATISGFSSAARTNMDMCEVNICIHRLIHYRVFSNQCANPPSSQIMAMQARTIRSRSCGPSLPTAMREFATELGKSRAFTVIIWKIIVKHRYFHQWQKKHTELLDKNGPVYIVKIIWIIFV